MSDFDRETSIPGLPQTLPTAVAVLQDRHNGLRERVRELEGKLHERMDGHDLRIRRLEVAVAKASVLIVLASAVASALMSWGLGRL